MWYYGFNMLKGGSECGNNWVKNPLYSAPAVKRLNGFTMAAYLKSLQLLTFGLVKRHTWLLSFLSAFLK